MKSRKLFPYVVAACFCVSLPITASAQKTETRARQVGQAVMDVERVEVSKEDPIIISEASANDIKLTSIPSATSSSFHNLISAAIDERLGARYRWGGTGPSTFDCSGFVWSIFQAAGVSFERASARTLWSRFEPPSEAEKYKFGTLVFFSHLAHVGVVADEKGFYHASRHHGVIYSPFSDYWLARLDGFRKVPTTEGVVAVTKPIE
jgi:cell wall-associated NlpC family hydrolase